MAIRRCPYCKAIIDEQDKYCNNCGTQLLFPEDEFVEEEIPGDKIVDEEEAEEEQEEEEKESLDEEPELEAELEDEEEALEEEDEEGEDEEAEEEEEEEEEEEKKEKKEKEKKEEEREKPEVDEGVEEEEEELQGAGEGDEVEEAGAESGEDKEGELELEEELEEEAEQEREAESGEDIGEEFGTSTIGGTDEQPGEGAGPAAEAGAEEPGEPDAEDREAGEPAVRPADSDAWKFQPRDAEKKYEVSLEQDELVFKTKELEKLTRTVDEGKLELENFLESHREFAAKDTTSDTKDGLPPWVSRIRETPATVEPAEEAQEEPKPRREWTTDSGIGVPEKITQAALPFGDTGSREIETSDEEKAGVDEETEEATAEEEAARRPAPLSLKLRAKVVDWVFVTALWLISLGFTSQVVGVSFFRLIFGSPVPVLAFYVILLVLYFFLFLYFLGETPGDHYFSEGD
jgi:hypothetical protein